ncbi:hypothetical protein BS47DRAFT_1389315 [Hydnum rufescens UP504]|uniref:Uncharacterized protein n=1 Tax=Hydnum rufescens UP504 TaxID=1448309 RepID=A0A9P6B5Q5_9AGAM|nr:hypothetical protein BS47DRAFT_1389315 [Hydnum rufescens UP504]
MRVLHLLATQHHIPACLRPFRVRRTIPPQELDTWKSTSPFVLGTGNVLIIHAWVSGNSKVRAITLRSRSSHFSFPILSLAPVLVSLSFFACAAILISLHSHPQPVFASQPILGITHLREMSTAPCDIAPTPLVHPPAPPIIAHTPILALACARSRFGHRSDPLTPRSLFSSPFLKHWTRTESPWSICVILAIHGYRDRYRGPNRLPHPRGLKHILLLNHDEWPATCSNPTLITESPEPEVSRSSPPFALIILIPESRVPQKTRSIDPPETSSESDEEDADRPTTLKDPKSRARIGSWACGASGESSVSQGAGDDTQSRDGADDDATRRPSRLVVEIDSRLTRLRIELTCICGAARYSSSVKVCLCPSSVGPSPRAHQAHGFSPPPSSSRTSPSPLFASSVPPPPSFSSPCLDTQTALNNTLRTGSLGSKPMYRVLATAHCLGGSPVEIPAKMEMCGMPSSLRIASQIQTSILQSLPLNTQVMWFGRHTLSLSSLLGGEDSDTWAAEATRLIAEHDGVKAAAGKTDCAVRRGNIARIISNAASPAAHAQHECHRDLSDHEALHEFMAEESQKKRAFDLSNVYKTRTAVKGMLAAYSGHMWNFQSSHGRT